MPRGFSISKSKLSRLSSCDMKGSYLYFVDIIQRKISVFFITGIFLLWKIRWEALLKSHSLQLLWGKKTLHKQLPRLIKITYYIQIKTIDHLEEQLQSSATHWHRILSVFSAWVKAKWLFRFLQLINFQAGLLRIITFSFSVDCIPISLLVFRE